LEGELYLNICAVVPPSSQLRQC